MSGRRCKLIRLVYWETAAMYSCTRSSKIQTPSRTPPAGSPTVVYTTSTDVDVPCKNEFLFAFFFPLAFPFGDYSLYRSCSLRLRESRRRRVQMGKRERERASAYIYVRIISDGGGGEGCYTAVDVWRCGTEDFVE